MEKLQGIPTVLQYLRHLTLLLCKIPFVGERHTTEICGVYVEFMSLSASWDEWEPVLEEWLPVLEEAGHLDGLEGIHIRADYLPGLNSAGVYNSTLNYIGLKPTLDDDRNFKNTGAWKEGTLLHEVGHHADIKNHISVDTPTQILNIFRQNISYRAGTNKREAIAETYAHITLGRKTPRELRKLYLELDGPVPPQNWENPYDAHMLRPEDSSGGNSLREI